MGITDLSVGSGGIKLVEVPQEPEMGTELRTVIEMFRAQCNFDACIDLCSAEHITYSSMLKLLELRKLMVDCGHRLVLVGDWKVKAIFAIHDLDDVFEIAEDRSVALTMLTANCEKVGG